MKKNERISAMVKEMGAGSDGFDPCYTGYFECFNRQAYYEAHDVLEHLWLKTEGAEALFFKGLIQIAGAYVHLQKQWLRPDHPKDGHRLRPASRLFRLGASNILPYAPVFLRLDVVALCALCEAKATEIEVSEYRQNPWCPQDAPRLALLRL